MNKPDDVKVGKVFVDLDARRYGRRLIIVEVNWTMRRAVVETMMDAGVPTRRTKVKIDRLLSHHYKAVPPVETGSANGPVY